MSNGVRRRAITRLPREEGGPRSRRPHRRVRARLFWQRERQVAEMRAEAERMLAEEFGESDAEVPLAAPTVKRVVWGHGCGPGQQRASEGLSDDEPEIGWADDPAPIG